jgi:phage-related protein
LADLIEILINATDNASSKIDRVNSSISKLGSAGTKVTGILAGVTGSIAGMAPAVAGVGALASTFASAGLGAVGFGAVAVPAIMGVVEAQKEIAKAEEAIKNADSSEERIKAQQQLKTLYAGMSTAQKGAVKDLQNFTTWWGTFTKSFETPVFKVFGEGLKLIQNTMTAMQPAIMAVGNALGGFLEKVNSSFDTSTARSFFDYINSTAGGSFSAVMTSAGNIMVGFMGILQAFAPLSGQFNNGMISMTQSFAQWGQSLASSQGFQNFVSFVQANTPVVLNLIRNLWTFLVQLVTALAPLGAVVLQVASSFAQWLATSSTVSSILSAISSAGQFLGQHLTAVKAVVVGLVTAFLAFRTIVTVVAIVQRVIQVFNMLKTAFLAVRTAMIMLNVAMLTNPFTWIVVAIVAVIAIIVLLVMHWDKVKAKAIEVGNAIKQAFTQMVTALAGVGAKIASFVSTAVSKFLEFRAKVRQAIADAITAVIQKLVELGSKMATSIGNAVSKAVTKFNELKARVGSAVQSMVSRVVQFFTQLGSKIASTVSSAVSKAVSLFNQFKSKVSSTVQSLVSKAVSLFNQFKSKVSSAIQSTVSKAVSLFNQFKSKVVSTVTTLASQITSKIKSAMTKFVSAVKSGATKAVSAIKTGVTNMISAVKGFVGKFMSAGKGLIEAFTKGIKSAMGKAKSAVSEGMSNIRSLLPFSPAKEGPLSDLDKSGESFFPTWYEGALKKVRPMTKAIGGAMSTMNSELQNKAGNVQLEAFNGGRATLTVTHKHVVEGTVDVNGDNSKESVTFTGQQVKSTVESNVLSDLRQAIRKN